MPTKPRGSPRVRTPGPTVEAAVTEHIDLLTGVGPDTRAHYRGQLRTHIAPVLRPYPVAAITYRHVASRVRTMSERGPIVKLEHGSHPCTVAARADAARLASPSPSGVPGRVDSLCCYTN